MEQVHYLGCALSSLDMSSRSSILAVVGFFSNSFLLPSINSGIQFAGLLRPSRFVVCCRLMLMPAILCRYRCFRLVSTYFVHRRKLRSKFVCLLHPLCLVHRCTLRSDVHWLQSDTQICPQRLLLQVPRWGAWTLASSIGARRRRVERA